MKTLYLYLAEEYLGGARPKANVTAPDGSLWIAKFPSARDEWDVGKREYARIKEKVLAG